MIRFPIIAAVICLIPHAVFAVEPILLRAGQGEYRLGPHVEVLEDKSGALTIHDIVHDLALAKSFRAATSLNLGYSKSVFWFRLAINNTSRHEAWVLEVPYPPLDRVSIFVPAATGFSRMDGGDRVAFSRRDLKHHRLAFPLKIEPGAVKLFYVRIQSEGSLVCSMNIWKQHRFSEVMEDQKLYLGIYFGIMFIMALYNLLLFFAIKDMNYLYYVVYVLASAVFQFTLVGFSSQYFWPNNPVWASQSLMFFGGFASATPTLFGLKFLELRRHTPSLSVVIFGLMLLGLFASIAPFTLGYSFAAPLGSFLGLVVPVVMIAAAVIVIINSSLAKIHVAIEKGVRSA